MVTKTAGLNAGKVRTGKDRAPRSFGHSIEGVTAATTVGAAIMLRYLDLIPLDAITVVTLAVLGVVLVVMHESDTYAKIMSATELSVDDYTHMKPGLLDRVYVVEMHRMSSGKLKKKSDITLTASPSPYMEGLMLNGPLTDPSKQEPLHVLNTRSGSLIVGSIRMGFGHHRIAQAASSWGVGLDMHTYFHDLLAIESPEADLIKGMDSLYSKGSRLATELGGPVERAWGMATLSGGANSLRNSWLMAEALTSLMDGLPRDTPIISSHSLVGMTAVAAGFKNVINCVIDNYAQWFCVVPGALNLVQGPANLTALLKMGIPSSDLRLAGHWVPKFLVDNIEEDCKARMERAKSGAPRRLLMPIGGAGAQKKLTTALVKSMVSRINNGTVQLYLNAGDRPANHKAFKELFKELKLKTTHVDDFEQLKSIIANPEKVDTPVVLIAFKEYFPSMCCTDMLIRIADVMVSKPSELAFYPIPKLMIRRVGDHEASSALRANEICDGTPEARDGADATRWMELFVDAPDMFTQMCKCIIDNHSIGVYNGSRMAVEIAQKMIRGEPY